jgi:hypothetical protein
VNSAKPAAINQHLMCILHSNQLGAGKKWLCAGARLCGFARKWWAEPIANHARIRIETAKEDPPKRVCLHVALARLAHYRRAACRWLGDINR